MKLSSAESPKQMSADELEAVKKRLKRYINQAEQFAAVKLMDSISNEQELIRLVTDDITESVLDYTHREFVAAVKSISDKRLPKKDLANTRQRVEVLSYLTMVVANAAIGNYPKDVCNCKSKECHCKSI